MKIMVSSDFTQMIYSNGPVQVIPAMVSGVAMLVPDESADPNAFYAGATAPPLAVLVTGDGLPFNGADWTYRCRVVRKSDSAVVVDQPATFATDPSGIVLSYGWSAGPLVAGTYWYEFVATHTATSGVYLTHRRTLQVRPPV